MVCSTRIKWKFMTLALAGALVMPAGGWAQAAKKQAPAAAMEIEEITVTAQKREESIQETPISVTALGTEALQQKGVTDVVAIGETVPAVRITSNPGSPASTTITIRGMTQGNPEAAFQPKAGMYVDGAYIAKIVGNNFDLEDLDRLEVLRGPQGTLYGRNTIGGAVSFITKKPTEDREIRIKTEVGNYETSKSHLMVNVPLIGKNGFTQSDALGTLSLRNNFGYKTHDGFYKNGLTASMPATPTTGGAGDYENLNRIYNTVALRWAPSKNVTVDYSFEYHRYRDHPTATFLTYIYPGSIQDVMYRIPGTSISIPNPLTPGGLVPYIQKNRNDTAPSNALMMYGDGKNPLHQQRDDGNHRMHILNGAWDVGEVGPLGNVTLKSISAYRSFSYESEQDLDGSPHHIAEFSQRNHIQTWSEELQWVGSAPRVHYVLGGYYYGEYAMQHESQIFFGGINNLPYKNFNRLKSYAAFGQLTYTPPILNDKLSLTAGMRFTKEQVHMTHIWGTDAGAYATAPGFTGDKGKAFGGLSGKGAPGISPMGDISYQATDEVMLYGRVSRGYTGGGFNPTAAIPQLFESFEPEKLMQYELGFKSQWLDNRLRFNADGYFSQYFDLQQSVFKSSPTLGALSIPANVDKAEIWGMEAEALAIPFRGVEVSANYSFLAPKYTEWNDQAFDANGNPIFDSSGKPVFESVADQRSFNFSPRNQISVGLNYTAPPTTTGVFSANVNWYWQDKTMFIVNNQTPGAQADEGWAYYLVNGRLAYTGIPLQKGTLDLAVFARNLFDRKYRTYGIDFGPQFGYSINNYGNPRTFGLQLAYNFTAGAEAPPPPPLVAQAAPPPPPAKKKIVLRSVHFDFDKATLKADAKPILDEAIQVLKQEGSVDIVVEGHTDSVGTDQYNLGLSRRRGETVRTYLVDHGIARSRITAEGMGESKPVASNDTADGRAQNRRVELHVK